MTLLYRDPLFLQHDTWQHPERPQRLVAAKQPLDRAGLAARCRAGEYRAWSPDQVTLVPSQAVVETVREAAEAGGGRIEADTVVSPASFGVGLAAAGACVSAVDAVLDGDDRTALC